MPTFSINGTLCLEANARISVMDHGLLYGDGVFEGLRFYQQNIFKVEEHLRRLKDSARSICLQLPVDKKELNETLMNTIDASGLQNGYIRLLVTRGSGPLGVDPASCTKPQVIIIVDQLSIVPPEVLDNGASLIISSVPRLAANQVDPRIKSLNYMNQIMARLEANAVGADEAIMLNDQGRVAEGTADNIFIVKDGTLYTPPLSEGALAGITRSTIISCAADTGLVVQEVPLSPHDLYTADECFLSGTGAELIPVREIAGRPMTQVRGPVFSKLLKAFHELTRASQS